VSVDPERRPDGARTAGQRADGQDDDREAASPRRTRANHGCTPASPRAAAANQHKSPAARMSLVGMSPPAALRGDRPRNIMKAPIKAAGLGGHPGR